MIFTSSSLSGPDFVRALRRFSERISLKPAKKLNHTWTNLLFFVGLLCFDIAESCHGSMRPTPGRSPWSLTSPAPAATSRSATRATRSGWWWSCRGATWGCWCETSLLVACLFEKHPTWGPAPQVQISFNFPEIIGNRNYNGIIESLWLKEGWRTCSAWLYFGLLLFQLLALWHPKPEVSVHLRYQLSWKAGLCLHFFGGYHKQAVICFGKTSSLFS